ncbi:laccase [Mycena maculata]|uniref:laccase n=1 Tax=Mycena maculata TaxID=230809 RepID=A0AAD7K8R5_9AGAR|nr:laccase [Mycena maculata]
MVFTTLLSLGFVSTAAAVSIGPTADITLLNVDVTPDGFTRSAVTANGLVPGPNIIGNKVYSFHIVRNGKDSHESRGMYHLAIHLANCLNSHSDEFNLNVIDNLTDETMLLSSSIHWHGFFQPNNSWADGPSFVNQCPIAQNASFLYTFPTNDQAGTFWYHSHLDPFVFSSSPALLAADTVQNTVMASAAAWLVLYDPEDPYLSDYDVDDDSTVITLSDWYHAPAHTLAVPATLISTLINGLGRYAGGPTSELSVITVTQGLRYRFRLINLSCARPDPNFIFTIDGHTFTIIEVDAVNHEKLEVDSIQIYAAQRYSFILTADQAIDNYWIRTVANGGTAGFDNGINSAILRYVGAAVEDPVTNATTSVAPLVETDLHPLDGPAVPGQPFPGGADVTLNLLIALDFTTGDFSVNGATFVPPTVPVLLQILSGEQLATDLLPSGSVYVLPPNSVIEVSVPGGTPGAPHPFHLHGHNFHVVRSAGNSTYNYDNPVIRDVVSTGPDTTDNVTFRFVTNNAGPHIDFHLEAGLAIVFAEDVATIDKSVHPGMPFSLPLLECRANGLLSCLGCVVPRVQRVDSGPARWGVVNPSRHTSRKEGWGTISRNITLLPVEF